MKESSSFRKNRQQVQKALIHSGFLEPLIKDEPIKIREEKASKGKLQQITILNFPISDKYRPKSWRVHLEKEKTPFSNPPHFKTVETALLLFASDTLLVFLLEMKTSLKPYGDSGLRSIKKKFSDSIGRINIFLSTYFFDESYEGIRIDYKGIVFYNQENISQEALRDSDLRRSDMYRIFDKKIKHTRLSTPLDSLHEIEILFFQNDKTTIETIIIDFKAFFEQDWEHQMAIKTDFTLPTILT